MAQLDTTPTPSLTLEEVLDDGSTLTNPPADYRRLFLGEDGLVHLKDSAGAVTDVGSGGGGATAWVDGPGGDEVSLDTGRVWIFDANHAANVGIDAGIYLTTDGDDIELTPDSASAVDLNGGVGFLMRVLSADPTAVRDGHMYYNSITDKLRLRANGAWVDLN